MSRIDFDTFSPSGTQALFKEEDRENYHHAEAIDVTGARFVCIAMIAEMIFQKK